MYIIFVYVIYLISKFKLHISTYKISHLTSNNIQYTVKKYLDPFAQVKVKFVFTIIAQ